jgi:hypothetical protein
MQGDAFLVEVPKSGVVSTSTKSPAGTAHDTYLVRDPDGRERPLPDGSIRVHHLGGSKRGDGEWMEYEAFFLGSQAELDAAETEDQVLERVRVALQLH